MLLVSAVLPLPSSVALLLLLLSSLLLLPLLSVLYDANNALEEWHYDPNTSVTLFYYWLVFATQLLNNICLQNVLFIFTWF